MDPHPDTSQLLSRADWVVFALVLLITAASMAWGQRRRPKGGTEQARLLDLLIMGRRLTLPLFVMTLVSSWYGGILPVTQYAFESGIYNWVTQGAFWYAAYLVFAFLLIRRIRGVEARTLPELVARRVGPRAATVTAVLNLANLLPVIYALSLGALLHQFFDGSLVGWTFAGTLVVAGYSMWGGMRSVVYSDLVQFGVMCAAVALLLGWSVFTYGGLSFLRAELPATHWDLGGGMPWATTLAWGLVAMGTLVDPNFYQRCFAACDDRTARRGIILSTVIWCGFDLCTTFGAMYARAVVPEAESSTAYLVYGLQALPPGLRGFLLAGILATILSTLDSYLFLSGTTLAHDLGPRLWRERLVSHRYAILLTAVVAPTVSLWFDGAMVNVWKTIGSLFTGSLLVPLLWALLHPRGIKESHFIASVITGGVAMLLHHAVGATWFAGEALYPGLMASGAVVGIGYFLHRK